MSKRFPAGARMALRLGLVAFAWCVVVAGCESPSTVKHTDQPVPGPVVVSRPLDAGSLPSPLARCEQDNRSPAFKSCPRWRMAMPEACGSATQPSEIDPCRCMCDLCQTDGDCTAKSGGRCIKLPSALMGGYDENVCVYAGEPCHPAGKCAAGKFCVTYGGAPRCEAAPH